MPERYQLNRNKNETTRAQRKKCYMRRKNEMKDPIYARAGGRYSTHHVMSEYMGWIDISFMSKYHKRRYFAAALTTLEYDQLNEDDAVIYDLLNKSHPFPDDWNFIPDYGPSGEKKGWSRLEFSADWKEVSALRKPLEEQMQKAAYAQARFVRPSYEIKDYGPVAVGLFASLNTPSLNDESIVAFIDHFQSLGEPLTPGIVWKGEEVDVVPARLIERYEHSVNINAHK